MKRLKRSMFPLIMVLLLTACGANTPTTDENVPDEKKALKADVTVEVTVEDELPEEQAQRLEVLQGDTYWKAYLIEIGDAKQTLPSENLSIDLILWEDGRAQFREITDGIFLRDDRLLHMTWNLTEEQGIDIYQKYYEEPWLTAAIDGEELRMDYQGDIVYLKKEQLPEEAGTLYHPAQLEGIWLMESYEVEGDVGNTQPGSVEAMIFQTVWENGENKFIANSQKRDYWNDSWKTDYIGASTTILDESIYSGCGNEVWSVRVGELSELNENGYPIETETYVTLIDENTMLRQLYYSFDGGPGVSYQTFKRITPSMSDVEFEAADLEGGDYDCISYTDQDGNKTADVPEMKEFYVHLDVNSEMTVSWWDDQLDDRVSFNGEWFLGDSGVINLISEGYDGETEFTETCWFAGVIHGAKATNEGLGEYEPEMYLYYDGGIIQLKHNFGSGGENFEGDDSEYEDTMNSLEGNAFSSPPEALFIMYGENAYKEYIDESFESVFHYNLSSNGENSQMILLTAVLDNTLFWYEDENREEVWSERLNAGESVVLKIDVPEVAEEVLCININDEAVYYYEISTDSIYPDDWYYITE